jgi:hypothetical protein
MKKNTIIIINGNKILITIHDNQYIKCINGDKYLLWCFISDALDILEFAV